MSAKRVVWHRPSKLPLKAVMAVRRARHGAGVQLQHLRQVVAAHPPLPTCRDGPLLQVGEHVPRPVDLDDRDQPGERIHSSGRSFLRRAPGRSIEQRVTRH